MNLKNVGIVAVLLCLSILSGFVLHGQQEPTHVGRFQIAAVIVSSLRGGTELREPGIFKIDTATGECWQYLSGTHEGTKDGANVTHHYMGWYPAERPDMTTPR